MKTTELEGALLDYHTARAEGVPVNELELRADRTLCVRVLRNGPDGIDGVMVFDYSTNWALTGPLVERHLDMLLQVDEMWKARTPLKPIERPDGAPCYGAWGDTPLIAICRAVVRAAFGDEVEDLP